MTGEAETALERLEQRIAKLEPDAGELIGEYEAVLREMRTHARASSVIDQWVNRIDRARDRCCQAEGFVWASSGGEISSQPSNDESRA